jgi:hypothetical protein
MKARSVSKASSMTSSWLSPIGKEGPLRHKPRSAARLRLLIVIAPVYVTRSTFTVLWRRGGQPIGFSTVARSSIGVMPVAAIALLGVATFDGQLRCFRRQPLAPVELPDRGAGLASSNDRHRMPGLLFDRFAGLNGPGRPCLGNLRSRSCLQQHVNRTLWL